MKRLLGIGLIFAFGCAVDGASSLGGDGSGSQSDPTAMVRNNTQEAVSMPREGFPVELGERTPSSIAFEVMPSWDCGNQEPARLQTIFVCKTQGQGEEEKRTRRCYAVQPEVSLQDPYLQCSRGSTSFSCLQKILNNGRYHVGAVYQSAACGMYEFWWHGVVFVERDLSASLRALSDHRHLDHRMYSTIESPDLEGDDRRILKRASLRLDFELTETPSSESLWIMGDGLAFVGYDDSLDSDRRPRGGIEPCVRAEFRNEPPPPTYSMWNCKNLPGLPIRIDVNLYPPVSVPPAFWLNVQLSNLAWPVPEESQVRFDGIAVEHGTFLPYISH